LVTNQTIVRPTNMYTTKVIRRNSQRQQQRAYRGHLGSCLHGPISGRLVSAITNNAQLVYHRMNCRGRTR